MKHNLVCILFIVNLYALNDLWAQSWHFVKEKEGIRLYTGGEPNSALKSFKGETTLNVPVDEVNSLLIDPRNNDWWDKNVIQRKVLDYQKGRFVKYYLIYDLPWPLTDRDIVVEARMTFDSGTGEQTVITRSVLNIVPAKPDLVRITKYWQKWTFQPINKRSTCHSRRIY
jgi:hypothetical protein